MNIKYQRKQMDEEEKEDVQDVCWAEARKMSIWKTEKEMGG